MLQLVTHNRYLPSVSSGQMDGWTLKGVPWPVLTAGDVGKNKNKKTSDIYTEMYCFASVTIAG